MCNRAGPTSQDRSSPLASALAPLRITQIIAFDADFLSCFSSVQSLNHVRPFATPWTAVRQASLSITNSRSLLKFMSIESVILSNNLILCCPLLLHLQSFPASGSFPMNQFFTSGGQSISFSFILSPSNEYSGLISFRNDWSDLLAVQGTLRSLLQHHSSKHQFFGAQLSLYSNSHIHT